MLEPYKDLKRHFLQMPLWREFSSQSAGHSAKKM
jgi:hypothetical protein